MDPGEVLGVVTAAGIIMVIPGIVIQAMKSGLPFKRPPDESTLNVDPNMVGRSDRQRRRVARTYRRQLGFGANRARVRERFETQRAAQDQGLSRQDRHVVTSRSTASSQEEGIWAPTFPFGGNDGQ